MIHEETTPITTPTTIPIPVAKTANNATLLRIKNNYIIIMIIISSICISISIRFVLCLKVIVSEIYCQDFDSHVWTLRLCISHIIVYFCVFSLILLNLHYLFTRDVNKDVRYYCRLICVFCAILKAFTVPTRRQIVSHVVKVTNYADDDENILPIFSKTVLQQIC